MQIKASTTNGQWKLSSRKYRVPRSKRQTRLTARPSLSRHLLFLRTAVAQISQLLICHKIESPAAMSSSACRYRIGKITLALEKKDEVEFCRNEQANHLTIRRTAVELFLRRGNAGLSLAGLFVVPCQRFRNQGTASSRPYFSV